MIREDEPGGVGVGLLRNDPNQLGIIRRKVVLEFEANLAELDEVSGKQHAPMTERNSVDPSTALGAEISKPPKSGFEGDLAVPTFDFRIIKYDGGLRRSPEHEGAGSIGQGHRLPGRLDSFKPRLHTCR
jgi:hypothetical protein